MDPSVAATVSCRYHDNHNVTYFRCIKLPFLSLRSLIRFAQKGRGRDRDSREKHAYTAPRATATHQSWFVQSPFDRSSPSRSQRRSAVARNTLKTSTCRTPDTKKRQLR